LLKPLKKREDRLCALTPEGGRQKVVDRLAFGIGEESQEERATGVLLKKNEEAGAA